MPRHTSLKSTIFDATIVVLMVAAVSHLSANFWERFIIQNELTQMKDSLHFLKETLNDIGNAYDRLYKEVRGISEATEIESSVINYLVTEPDLEESEKTLDRRKHDISTNTFPPRTNTKHKANKYPSKENTKDEALTIPSKDNTKKTVKDESVNFPSKNNEMSETFYFQPYHVKDECSNTPLKADKTTERAHVVKRKNAGITSARQNLTTFKSMMTRLPEKSTGAGPGRNNAAITQENCDCSQPIYFDGYTYKDPWQYYLNS